MQPTTLCGQRTTLCVTGEWPRVIALLDDFNDWEVRRIAYWRGGGGVVIVMIVVAVVVVAVAGRD